MEVKCCGDGWGWKPCLMGMDGDGYNFCGNGWGWLDFPLPCRSLYTTNKVKTETLQDVLKSSKISHFQLTSAVAHDEVRSSLKSSMAIYFMSHCGVTGVASIYSLSQSCTEIQYTNASYKQVSAADALSPRRHQYALATDEQTNRQTEGHQHRVRPALRCVCVLISVPLA